MNSLHLHGVRHQNGVHKHFSVDGIVAQVAHQLQHVRTGMRPAKATGKLPGIVVFHENRGLNPHIEDITRRLALDNFIAQLG